MHSGLLCIWVIDPSTLNSEAPRLQGGASRKGNLIYIVPLDPAYKAGLAGHLPVTLFPNFHRFPFAFQNFLELFPPLCLSNTNALLISTIARPPLSPSGGEGALSFFQK